MIDIFKTFTEVSGIVVKQPLDIGCRTITSSIIGSTCDISFNNWLNSYVFVTLYGDIHVAYLRQMLTGFAEARRQRSILGYTDAVDIDKLNSQEKDAVVDDDTPILDEPQPSTSLTGVYDNVKDISYPSTNGIVFCDFQNVSLLHNKGKKISTIIKYANITATSCSNISYL